MDKIVQDIVPPSSRSIRRINVPRRPESHENREPVKPPEEPPRTSTKKKNRKRKMPDMALWLVVIVVVCGSIFAISYVFSGATLTVTPKQKDVAADILITAKKDAIPGDLPFEYVTLGKTVTQEVATEGEESVERKATGRIMIYNNFSTAPQRLVKNTRFESQAGRIYRIDAATTVPGKKTVEGKSVPGSAEVAITADAPGTSFNSDLTDFTIPGFKNDRSRFNGFYARSLSALTGGFSGNVKKVTQAVRQSTEQKMKDDLLFSIKNTAKAELPSDVILYDDALFSVFVSLPQQDQGNTTKLSESATSTLVFFNKAKLSEYLAKALIPQYDGSPLLVSNLQNLIVTIRNKSMQNPETTGVVSFNIKGPVHFVWLTDNAKLKKDLAGKAKRDLAQILVGYPSIEKTEAIVRPFWKTTFPENASRIKIQEKAELEN